LDPNHSTPTSNSRVQLVLQKYNLSSANREHPASIPQMTIAVLLTPLRLVSVEEIQDEHLHQELPFSDPAQVQQGRSESRLVVAWRSVQDQALQTRWLNRLSKPALRLPIKTSTDPSS
jgi:hypothetical protein